MNLKPTIIAFLVLVAALPAQVWHFNPATGSIYTTTDPVATWLEARAEARRMGGYLVSIGDAAEQRFLEDSIGASVRYWLGLTDEITEGVFIWEDGSPLGYTNWEGNNPNNGNLGEDYVHWLPGSGRWNDSEPVGATKRGIVEIPVVRDPRNGHLYFRTGSVTDVHEARTLARSLGGFLASIADSQEQTLIAQNLATADPLWIGLSDARTEGQFEWDDGDSSAFRNWASAQPNNASPGQHYVAMLLDGSWNDVGEVAAGIIGGAIVELHPRPVDHHAVRIVAHNGLSGCFGGSGSELENVLDLFETGTWTNLCSGGSITLRLGVAAVDGPGPDINILEDAAIVDESFMVEVSLNGVDWVNIPGPYAGAYFGSSHVDLANSGLTEVHYVRLTDLTLRSSGSRPGAEIVAVSAMNYRTPRGASASAYADVLLSASDPAIDPADLLGPPNAAQARIYDGSSFTIADSGFHTMASGEEFVLGCSTHRVVDGPGPDLVLVEFSEDEGSELDLYASEDGRTWVRLDLRSSLSPRYGTRSQVVNNVQGFDLAGSGLAKAEFFRVIATVSGPDFDSLELLNTEPRPLQGSGEGLAMHGFRNGVLTQAQMLIAAGDLMELQVTAMDPRWLGSLVFVGMQATSLSQVPDAIPGLPSLLLDPTDPGFFLVFDPTRTMSPLGPSILGTRGLDLAFLIPPALPQVRLRWQGLAFDPATSNGLFTATDAIETLIW